MLSQANFPQDFKPTFSGHFTFALRYGWLEKSFDAVDSNGGNPFQSQDAIATFGVGRKMVDAIKHWALATGFINASQKNHYKVSEYAKSLMSDSNDPFLENINSLWKIHYELVKNPKNITLHYLFCFLNDNIFDRDLFNSRITEFLKENNLVPPAEDTLNSDITVSFNTYSSTTKNGPGDDAVNSPMTELGLIRNIGDGRFSLNLGTKSNLPNNLFLSCLVDYWEQEEIRSDRKEMTTIKFEDILYSPRSPGRIFLLGEKELSNRLSSIEEISEGQIIWSETAGLQQLLKTEKYQPDKLLQKWCLDYE